MAFLFVCPEESRLTREMGAIESSLTGDGKAGLLATSRSDQNDFPGRLTAAPPAFLLIGDVGDKLALLEEIDRRISSF